MGRDRGRRGRPRDPGRCGCGVPVGPARRAVHRGRGRSDQRPRRVTARRDRRGWWWVPLAAALLAVSLVLGVLIGPAGSWGDASWTIVWNLRMPRVALAAIVGAMLSLAG